MLLIERLALIVMTSVLWSCFPYKPLDHFECVEDASCSLGPDGSCLLNTAVNQRWCSYPDPACVSGRRYSNNDIGDGDCVKACTEHAQCSASNACLPDGACANEGDVAYVAPDGTGNICTKMIPCAKVANALATGRRYLKLHGTTDEAVTITDQHVIVLADPGATLTRTTNGNLLVVDGTSDVQIYDLAINGASGNGAGILLPLGGTQSLTLKRVTMSGNIGTGGAITAFGATTTIVSSTLSGNAGRAITVARGVLNLRQSTIYGNGGGGISLQATSFDLENNVIARNGSPGAVFGGVLVNQLGSGAHRLEFNTIAQNGVDTGFTGGVTCLLIIQPISFGNNIVYGNSVMQVSGQNCDWTYSDIGPDTVAGMGNLNADPFNAVQGNFHLTSGSPAIDQADPNATLTIDVDGNARPHGGRRDIGADEYDP